MVHRFPRPFPVPLPSRCHHVDGLPGGDLAEPCREPCVRHGDVLGKEFRLRPLPCPEPVNEVIGNTPVLRQDTSESESLGPCGPGDGASCGAYDIHALAASSVRLPYRLAQKDVSMSVMGSTRQNCVKEKTETEQGYTDGMLCLSMNSLYILLRRCNLPLMQSMHVRIASFTMRRNSEGAPVISAPGS